MEMQAGGEHRKKNKIKLNSTTTKTSVTSEYLLISTPMQDG